jgi:hypothetical protein
MLLMDERRSHAAQDHPLTKTPDKFSHVYYEFHNGRYLMLSKCKSVI